MKLVIIAFNIGTAGRFVNGPGMTLFNFIKFYKSVIPESTIDIFTQLNCSGYQSKLISNKDVPSTIASADCVIHWSGITEQILNVIKLANRLDKQVIIGPNVIDTVELAKEKDYFEKVKFDKLFSVNERLVYQISKAHDIDINKIKTLMVGPDLDLWTKINEKNNAILWKGNGKQYAKDVSMGLEIAASLPQYEFKFIGHPEPYEYAKHIIHAKQCKLYMCTSKSETMGLALMEQWAAGVPSITHPKIYMHGINYKTGIITNRDINSYREAIVEIMENNDLYQHLSLGAENYMKTHFNPKNIIQKFLKDIG